QQQTLLGGKGQPEPYRRGEAAQQGGDRPLGHIGEGEGGDRFPQFADALGSGGSRLVREAQRQVAPVRAQQGEGQRDVQRLLVGLPRGRRAGLADGQGAGAGLGVVVGGDVEDGR